jgi:hypothetical protein
LVEQLLYDARMKLKTTDGAVVEVSDAVILPAAGVIYSSRRKAHGHPPLHAADGRDRHRGGGLRQI